MVTRRITERFQLAPGARVDRSGPRPFVRGVLLCGATSANRRRYRREAFAGDRIRRYEGKPVYLNHAAGRGSRRYEEQIGWVRNPRHNAAGMPIGDIEVKPAHPMASTFLDDAEHKPNSCGMSHVAQCETSRAADGWEDVTAVVEVESVDVVLDPATVTSLFESIHARGKTVKTTVRKLIEKARVASRRFPGHIEAAVSRLREAAADVLDEPAEELDDTDPGVETGGAESVRDAFLGAATAVLNKAIRGQIDPKIAAGKIEKILERYREIAADLEDALSTVESRRGVRENRRTISALVPDDWQPPRIPDWDSWR